MENMKNKNKNKNKKQMKKHKSQTEAKTLLRRNFNLPVIEAGMTTAVLEEQE